MTVGRATDDADGEDGTSTEEEDGTADPEWKPTEMMT
jgi:hypothetical protein